MAQVVKLNYNISNNSGTLYDNNGNLMSEKSQGITIGRVNPIPLEKYEIFNTVEAAEGYAKNNPVAYAGQQISVVETEYNEDGTVKNVNVQAYIVAGTEQADGSWLIPVSQGANMSDVEITVWEDWTE